MTKPKHPDAFDRVDTFPTALVTGGLIGTLTAVGSGASGWVDWFMTVILVGAAMTGIFLYRARQTRVPDRSFAQEPATTKAADAATSARKRRQNGWLLGGLGSLIAAGLLVAPHTRNQGVVFAALLGCILSTLALTFRGVWLRPQGDNES